jgi:hypothetical protein
MIEDHFNRGTEAHYGMSRVVDLFIGQGRTLTLNLTLTLIP